MSRVSAWILAAALCVLGPMAARLRGQPPEPAPATAPEAAPSEVRVRVEGAAGGSLFTAGLPDLTTQAPTLALVEMYRTAAVQAEQRNDPVCVDLYYQATVIAYACIRGAPDNLLHQAQIAYNGVLGDCLRAAMIRGTLAPRATLTVKTRAGEMAVPITHHGFVWQADDFSTLFDPSQIPVHPERKLIHRRVGMGASRVVLRARTERVPGSGIGQNVVFPCTAILVPDVAAWSSTQVAGQPRDRLILFDPLRVPSVAVQGRPTPLAADLDAPLSLHRLYLGGDKYKYNGVLHPDQNLPLAGLFLLEPFQGGKIPVIFIHGLASSPLSWCDIIPDLQATPGFLDRYQVWVFTYPTGLSFLRSAQLLRDELKAVVAHYDPAGSDPMLRQMVLVGHSMGGLVTKLQTVSSGDRLWNAIVTVPPDQLRDDQAAVKEFERLLFFEPSDRVTRVIFIATPHRGSKIANQLGGRLASSLIKKPTDTKSAIEEIEKENPGALRPAFRKMPTSIDLLETDHPLLLAMLTLPRGPGVSYHSIIGTAKNELFSGVATDGVVPIHSARLPNVQSEDFVSETHGTILHSLKTIELVRELLEEHWRAVTGGVGAPVTDLAAGALPPAATITDRDLQRSGGDSSAPRPSSDPRATWRPVVPRPEQP